MDSETVTGEIRVLQTVGEPTGIQMTRILPRAICELDLELSDGTVLWGMGGRYGK